MSKRAIDPEQLALQTAAATKYFTDAGMKVEHQVARRGAPLKVWWQHPRVGMKAVIFYPATGAWYATFPRPVTKGDGIDKALAHLQA